MAHASHADGAPASTGRSLRTVGLALVLATKAVDVALTVALVDHDLVMEINPMARAAIETAGAAPGLLALTAVYLGLVVGVTEAGAVWLERAGEWGPGPALTRAVGYGLATAVTVWALARNAQVVMMIL